MQMLGGVVFMASDAIRDRACEVLEMDKPGRPCVLVLGKPNACRTFSLFVLWGFKSMAAHAQAGEYLLGDAAIAKSYAQTRS